MNEEWDMWLRACEEFNDLIFCYLGQGDTGLYWTKRRYYVNYREYFTGSVWHIWMNGHRTHTWAETGYNPDLQAYNLYRGDLEEFGGIACTAMEKLKYILAHKSPPRVTPLWNSFGSFNIRHYWFWHRFDTVRRSVSDSDIDAAFAQMRKAELHHFRELT